MVKRKQRRFISRLRIIRKKSDIVSRIRHHPKNIFSTTQGLKKFKVGNKKFAPTKAGKEKAEKEASKLFSRTGKAKIEYIY